MKHYEKYIDCFTRNAVIDDIKHVVRNKISDENSDSQDDLDYQLEPIAIVETNNQIFLKVKVVNTFESRSLHLVLKMYLSSGLTEKLKIEIVE